MTVSHTTSILTIPGIPPSMRFWAQVTPGRDTGYAPRDEPGDAIEVDFVGPTTGYSDAFSFRDSG